MTKIFRIKKYFILLLAALLMVVWMSAAVWADGPFGPPEPLSKAEGGLNTAVGYWYAQDTFKNPTSVHALRQHSIYSHAAYGAGKLWEVYGRIGVADLRISDAFQPANAFTASAKDDFAENWKFFGTLGAKGFHALNGWFGIGAFVQGTYHFSNYTDSTTGVYNGAPFEADLKIKNLWAVAGGVGFQVSLPCTTKLYGGPYLYYTDARLSLSPGVAGVQIAARDDMLSNRSIAGGYAGVDIALTRGFRLNIEGHHAERLSLGAAITYTY